MNKRRVYSGKPFTVLTGIAPLERTATFGQIMAGGKLSNDLMVTDPAGIVPASGSFTVNDNDFTTGRAEIILGNYSIVSNVDFYPGINVAATAANIVLAISGILPGFRADRIGAVVTVYYDDGSANDVDFRVVHLGEKVNFNALSPSTGLLQFGSPRTQGMTIS
jgi:hypothetical protein